MEQKEIGKMSKRINIKYLYTGFETFGDVNLKIGWAFRRYYFYIMVRLHLPKRFGKLCYVYRNFAFGYYKEGKRWVFGTNK